MSSTSAHQSASRPTERPTPRLSAGKAARPSPDGEIGPSRAGLERLYNEAEALIQSFNCASAKGRVDLGRTSLLRGLVQHFKKDGGERSLHYHGNTDCFWMVLRGRVRFYGQNDGVIGEYGPQEGAIMPAYARYWFENVGDGDLELLQVMAFHDRDRKDSGRVDGGVAAGAH
jgi:mannose-6-phosphate isomerase-like protein (cupin superfamily)